MPKYDYHCDACERTFELKLPLGSSSDQDCPECDSAARRLLTPPALVFKGSGFYETDYRSDSYQKGAKAESKSDSNSKDSKDSKDSKSASDSPNNKSVKKKKVEKKN